jgi:YVTN family beta-propeller protein
LRTAVVYRTQVKALKADVGQANYGESDEVQFEMCEFTDGRVAQRWRVGARSCVWWDSFQDLYTIHIYAHPDDIASGTAVYDLPINGVTGLVISPAGTLLYAISCDRRTYYQYPPGRLTIVDATSGTVADAIAIGACPGSVNVSPDGTCLAVTHYDTRLVSMVDLATAAVTAVGLRDAPPGAVFTPDGTHVYVTNERSLTVIDTTTTDAYDLVAGDLPRGLQLSPDGKHAYSTNFGDGTISVIDTITNSIAATLDALSHPEAVAVSADGERVYVGDYWSRAVAVISVPLLRDLLGST